MGIYNGIFMGLTTQLVGFTMKIPIKNPTKKPSTHSTRCRRWSPDHWNSRWCRSGSPFEAPEKIHQRRGFKSNAICQGTIQENTSLVVFSQPLWKMMEWKSVGMVMSWEFMEKSLECHGNFMAFTGNTGNKSWGFWDITYLGLQFMWCQWV